MSTPSLWRRFNNYLHKKYFQYELHTSLYLFEPWEKVLFNTILIAVAGMSTYTTYYFLPRYTRRVLEYFEFL